jgi:predicted nucleic acid-binding protein
MIVVSDTSPITTRLQIGRADLLHKLFGEVLIPRAVLEELAVMHLSLPAFFKCVPVIDIKAVDALLAELDAGEAEAIVLAKEKGALLLIDEIDGRGVAAREGIRYIGLLGILIQAKLVGYLPSLRETLNEIESKTAFFISREMMNLALKKAGEL